MWRQLIVLRELFVPMCSLMPTNISMPKTNIQLEMVTAVNNQEGQKLSMLWNGLYMKSLGIEFCNWLCWLSVLQRRMLLSLWHTYREIVYIFTGKKSTQRSTTKEVGRSFAPTNLHAFRLSFVVSSASCANLVSCDWLTAARSRVHAPPQPLNLFTTAGR